MQRQAKRADRGRSAHRKPAQHAEAIRPASPAPDLLPASWAGARFNEDQGPALPGQALTPQLVEVRLYPPYYCAIVYRTRREHHLTTMQERADGGLVNRHIEAGDLLVFDTARETIAEGEITMVEIAPKEWQGRIYRHTAQGPEYHPDAPGFPILRGQHRTCGVLVGVVRDYRGDDDADDEEAEGDEEPR